MSPVDKQLIIRKIKLIEEDLDKLRRFENTSIRVYMQSFETRLQVERLLERIVGRVLDINYHILKEDYNVIPNDYFKSFIQMGENNIVESGLAKSIAESAGLRNALAHEYDVIDDSLVYASINKSLTQIPKYLDQILDKYSD